MKKQIHRLCTAFVSLLLASPALLLLTSTSALAAPAVCYTTTGPLQVAPTTTGCSVDPGGRIVYINSAGQPVTSPAEDACYTGEPASGSGSFQSRTFTQQDCAALNTLLLARRQALCTASNGNWTTYTGGGAPTATCSCGEGRVINTTTYECGAIPPPSDNGGSSGTGNLDVRESREADCRSENGEDLTEENCGIIGILNIVFNLVSGAISIAVIGNIIVAGIQYSSAQGDPGAAAKAKTRIRNALIAFLMYLGLFGFIQWLIPGGVF